MNHSEDNCLDCGEPYGVSKLNNGKLVPVRTEKTVTIRGK
jgi:hypothetical protein